MANAWRWTRTIRHTAAGDASTAFVARVDRRDDYRQLLADGQVICDVDDVEAWRAEIRRQAGADEIKLRTRFNERLVWVSHLQMIQEVIGRLGNDSFLIKGWAVTIAGRTFASPATQ